ncbi:hypothetical protein CCO03_02835 [Comamonas serinivorans]|uniref:Uncharacterized protein n=1 Tax=Comamonas serinivorans TaxID=1082851 RepID=A0A1Y0EJX3_9BURK|nr:ankyrin repeat domain-containing protein [Comamonas serinivorans]ARU03760.1 hypothetical protein CCO03_02835 [Comamonas serinivorans]
MKRLDTRQTDAALAATCMQLAARDPARQALAVSLLVAQRRWPALEAYLQTVAADSGPATARALALPTGRPALLHLASSDPAATARTLDALKTWGWLASDAQARAVARTPAPWEQNTFPVTPPSAQQWLNAGLRAAVHSDDLARVRWWQDQGADVRHQDDDGCNAVQAAKSVAMLDALLTQGAPTDGCRRWDGRAIDRMARDGRADLLARMAAHGADFASLGWSPLHRLVVMGSASDLEAALADPAQAALRTQLEARQSWGRTPISYAAQQGDVRKLEALRRAGADVQVVWRDHTLGYWVGESREPDAMRWWLAQPGVHVDAVVGGLGSTLLIEAVERDDLRLAVLLLAAGASVHIRGELTSPLEAAISPAMQRLLMQHGAPPDALDRHGARVWLGLPHGDPFDHARQAEWLLGCTPTEFAAQHTPRLDTHNGEDITSAFHVAMIESNESAYGAAQAFGLEQSFADEAWAHVWNTDRFGQSLTVLPDGRCIQIGGEHEDGYDPDFFIYNDVIVHTPPAAGSDDPRWDRRVFAYPADVFPPTDHHSATLCGDEVIVIGCLGHDHQRQPGHTPVYALHIHSLQMRRIVCEGDGQEGPSQEGANQARPMPGWIHGHQARLTAPGVIEVWGGKHIPGPSGLIEDWPERWQLDVPTGRWTRLA